MAWRKWLSLVGALAGIGLGAGAGVPMLGGCTRGAGASPRITTHNPFSLMPDLQKELCGYEFGSRQDSTVVAFGEPLGFNRAGETIAATAYEVITLLDGQAVGGKYAMQATFVKGDSGGPAGSVTEYSVEVEGVRLVERLVRPPAPAGVKALLPGEFVLRKIRDGELLRVNEKYLVELPANKHAFVVFEPPPTDYPFQVSVSKNGVTVPAPFVKEIPHDWVYAPPEGRAEGYRFDTGTGGLFDIAVQGTPPTGQVPDRYQFYVGWGDALGRSSGFRPDWVELKDPSVGRSKASNQQSATKRE
jgi:hypothetical protein